MNRIDDPFSNSINNYPKYFLKNSRLPHRFSITNGKRLNHGPGKSTSNPDDVRKFISKKAIEVLDEKSDFPPKEMPFAGKSIKVWEDSYDNLYKLAKKKYEKKDFTAVLSCLQMFLESFEKNAPILNTNELVGDSILWGYNIYYEILISQKNITAVEDLITKFELYSNFKNLGEFQKSLLNLFLRKLSDAHESFFEEETNPSITPYPNPFQRNNVLSPVLPSNVWDPSVQNLGPTEDNQDLINCEEQTIENTLFSKFPNQTNISHTQDNPLGNENEIIINLENKEANLPASRQSKKSEYPMQIPMQKNIYSFIEECKHQLSDEPSPKKQRVENVLSPVLPSSVNVWDSSPQDLEPTATESVDFYFDDFDKGIEMLEMAFSSTEDKLPDVYPYLSEL